MGCGLWVIVWWWIKFGGEWNFVMAGFCVCDGGRFVICDLGAGLLFCDWWFVVAGFWWLFCDWLFDGWVLWFGGCFVMVVASSGLILGYGLGWWQVGGWLWLALAMGLLWVGLASGDYGFTRFTVVCFCLWFWWLRVGWWWWWL